jgi:uncharacterized protein with ATP-grasp and redox domains
VSKYQDLTPYFVLAIITKGVPAEICDNCGEYYLDEVVSMKVLTQGEKAVATHAEVEIIRYAA